MTQNADPFRPNGFLSCLAENEEGNIIPLLATVGGGIDIGRIYLTQSQLQGAYDATSRIASEPRTGLRTLLLCRAK